MMDMKKLFAAAEAAGITCFEARVQTENKLSVTVFNTDCENYTVAENSELVVRGIADGKCGTFTSDRIDDDVIDMAVAALKQSAEYGSPGDPDLFIRGDEYEYEKTTPRYHAALTQVPSAEFIATAKSVAAKILDLDPRVESAQVDLEYDNVGLRIANSNGLDIMDIGNCVTVFASVKAVSGMEVKSGSHYEFVTDLSKFDIDAFAALAVADAVSMLGGASVATGRYDVVYSPDCAALLVKTLCSGFSAFAAEQHMSLIEGKLGTQAFSPYITLESTPDDDTPFGSAFDAEGVPQSTGMLIRAGVPLDYVYDLATAKRAGRKTTGNGRLEGGIIRPAVECATVRCGGMSRERLIAEVRDGLYVTGLAGAHAGMDAQSGNYSLQAEGFEIRDGKIAKPVSLITIASNIMDDFKNVIGVADDTKLTYYGVKTPSIAVRGLAVSGMKSDKESE